MAATAATRSPLLPQNWATGAFVTRELAPPPAHPTLFEITVQRLQLESTPHLWPYDAALRKWVKVNKNKHYVPEELLAAYGMHVVMED
jgi:hypothetical protein